MKFFTIIACAYRLGATDSDFPQPLPDYPIEQRHNKLSILAVE